VSDNGTRLSTQHKVNGKAVPPVVTIPPPAGINEEADGLFGSIAPV
jgi:hypothetical protein